MKHKQHSNTAIHTLYFFNGIFMFGGSLLGPLYALYVANIQNGALAASLSWAVYLVSSTIMTFLVSLFGDQVKETEYLLVIGYFLRSICWASFIFVPSWNWLLLAQIGIGIGDALGAPAFDTLMASHLDKGKHMSDYATWKLISSIVLALGTVAGGYIVNYYGFVPLFALMSAMAAIAGIGILVKPRKLL
jgi:MFS family permease